MQHQGLANKPFIIVVAAKINFKVRPINIGPKLWMGLFSSRIASIFRALDFGRKTKDPTLIVGSYLLE